ncbi:DUF1961 family protein [Pullulanibacillus sp. KACC 23026]|uniref:DUF1961 family protein n=1 Tax=Pullulanibacillus sp. KACC 23026 TaxID=3028315 RepID=UPI0023AE8751|nr:DUF1961 family protein [Pullulanibacillus sp. KACC 23026]WEG13703.1 DUF1961 family protein [Pullulanibacillus sp. KACC 23026]
MMIGENHFHYSLSYSNPLQSEEDVKAFRLEGEAAITFPLNRMRMENKLDPAEGQKSNFVYWCPEEFPSNIAVTWDFWPIAEPGLCILFFAAKGRQGEDLFESRLKKRHGIYDEYHHGDMDAFHVSYFRRKEPDERTFHTCNLRKSYGFHLVTQGADPIPSVHDAKGPYSIELLKYEGMVTFSINGLTVFSWEDDGQTYGPLLSGGKIGFRQTSPLIAEYANLKVYEISKK